MLLQFSLVSILWYPHRNGTVNFIVMYADNLEPGWILADRVREIQTMDVTCSVPRYRQKPVSVPEITLSFSTSFSIWGGRQRMDAKAEVKTTCKISVANYGNGCNTEIMRFWLESEIKGHWLATPTCRWQNNEKLRTGWWCLFWQYQYKPKCHLHRVKIVSNRIKLKAWGFFSKMFYSMQLPTSDLILEAINPNLLCPHTTAP